MRVVIAIARTPRARRRGSGLRGSLRVQPRLSSFRRFRAMSKGVGAHPHQGQHKSPAQLTQGIVTDLGLTFGHSSFTTFPQRFPRQNPPRAKITSPVEQVLGNDDLQLLKKLVGAKQWDELAEAREFKQRVPVRGAGGCNAVGNPRTCCYRVPLMQRLEQMAAWSRAHELPQRLNVLYPYAGADLLNSYGLFPSAPVHVLSAYHVAYAPNAETDDPADLFAETRRCLRDAECAHMMVEAAANYYRHIMCLGFRSAMSAWMEGRFFNKGIGTFPSMLLLTRLLDMDLLSVTMLRRPGVHKGDQTYHGTGFSLTVQRRTKLPTETELPPPQKIVYLGELYAPETVSPFFDSVERHISLKRIVFINKAILLLDSNGRGGVTGEEPHLTHGAFFKTELCNRGAIVSAMVQDATGFDLYFAGDLGIAPAKGIRIYGDCPSARAETDEFEWAHRVPAVLEFPPKVPFGARSFNRTAGRFSERRFYNSSDPLISIEPLPFGWSHYSMVDEADTGCLMVHLAPHRKADQDDQPSCGKRRTGGAGGKNKQDLT